jgi:hypothetical protein
VSRLFQIVFAACLAGASLFTPAPAQTEEDDFQRFAIIPVVGYTEETKFEYGLMGNFFFKPSFKGGRTSELDVIAYATTEDQYSASIAPLFFLFHDQLSGKVYFFYENWTGRFYGFGNDPDIDDYRKFERSTFYTQGELETNFLLPRKLSAFKYGVNFEFNNSTFKHEDYEGEIVYPGDVDGWRNGVGYHLTYDTRDNLNWARHGFFVQWEQDVYPKTLGDFDYSVSKLDLRGFSEFIWNTSMAVGCMWKRVNGNAPFDMLAGADGVKRFRGVKTNYFNGNQALFLQTEFRKALFWRLAGNIFFEGGKTGEYFSDLWREQWHTGVGFGGQLALNMNERLYARADLSLVDFKNIGLTFYLREAF